MSKDSGCALFQGIERRMARSALTLLEVMAALTLASLIMVVLMGTTKMLSKHQRITMESTPDTSWVSVANRRLQADFGRCYSVLFQDNKLLLRGVYPVVEPDGRIRHTPAMVIYEIQTLSGGQYLVRRSLSDSNSGLERSTVSIEARGVTSLEVTTPVPTDVPPGILGLRVRYEQGGQVLRKDFFLVTHGGRK